MEEALIWIMIAVFVGASKIFEAWARKRRTSDAGMQAPTPPTAHDEDHAPEVSDFEMFIQEMKAKRQADQHVQDATRSKAAQAPHAPVITIHADGRKIIRRDRAGPSSPPSDPRRRTTAGRGPVPARSAPPPLPRSAKRKPSAPDAHGIPVAHREKPPRLPVRIKPKQPSRSTRTTTGRTAPPASVGIPLPPHLTPLQQAVVLTEILGPARALSKEQRPFAC